VGQGGESWDDWDAVENAIALHDVHGAVYGIHLAQDIAKQQFAVRIRQLVVEAGGAAVKNLRQKMSRFRAGGYQPPEDPGKVDIKPRFDLVNPDVERWVKENTGDLVQT
jgi:hypothetical protein